MHKFYLICPINLESALIKELDMKDLTKKLEVLEIAKGGIEVKCELAFGLSLNKILKTPTRILLRIKEQKCRDFPKLYNIIKKINWKNYLVSYETEIKVSSSKSRIIHSDKAKKTIEDAISFYFKANKLSTKIIEDNKETKTQAIFVRIFKDELTISLDTSGDALYIRGNRSDRGHASIRESYACALLLLSLPKNHKELTLCDPMCGTGTFLSEAKNFYSQNLARIYQYEYWPNIKELTFEGFDLQTTSLFKDYLGFDIDKELIQRNKYQPGIQFEMKDFFENSFNSSMFIISNLPYGKRVKIQGNTHEYFTKVLEHLNKTNYALLLPESAHVKNKTLVRFNNNGIKVKLISL